MRRLFFLISVMCASISLNAQIVVRSATQKIVEQAIVDCIMLVRQSYYLVDKSTGEAYGRNNQDEFGSNVSLGILTNNGFVLNKKAASPWLFENDFDFQTYEKDYKPEIIKTEVKSIKEDSLFIQFPIICKPIEVDGGYISQLDGYIGNCLEVDSENGEKDGWVVWFLNKSSGEISTADITMESYTLKIDMTKKKNIYEINQPADTDKVIGGVYLSLNYLGGGHVVYKIVGYMVKMDDKWMITKIPSPIVCNGKKTENSDDESFSDIQHKNVLTPVKRIDDNNSGNQVESNPKSTDKSKKKRK